MACAEQILNQHRDKFLTQMDANTIVCELWRQGVISYGDMVMIQRTAGAIEQNQLLHDYLKRTCTEEALMKVCDMMMAVPGNPSMRVLGKEMKTIMEGLPSMKVENDDTHKDAIMFQNVTYRPDYLMLFRKYVSRTAAGKGREVLKCLGFDKATLHSCYKKNGLNVEEAIQEGLYRWCQGKGTQPPTWEVLLDAMCFAECAQKHIQGLKQQLEILPRKVNTDDCRKDAILSQKVYDHPEHHMLFRKHVSRNAASKGRAVLEGVGLDSATIEACFNNSPHDEEEALQDGLNKWAEGKGSQPPTWDVLLGAMQYAQIVQLYVNHLMENLEKSGEEQEEEQLKPPMNWTKGDMLEAKDFETDYMCRDLDTGQQLVVKEVDIVPHSHSDAPKEVQALEIEVELLKKLQHERIVTYFGTERREEYLYIFLEYMSGGSIQKRLQDVGPLPEVLTQKYTKQILQGVAYLHSCNIIHRDIKGANILIDSDDNIKLAGFGIPTRISIIHKPAKSVHGTPHWMAPEVIRENNYSTNADIWSVGCTVVEMLTGEPPLRDLEPLAVIFQIGSKPDTVCPQLPPHCSNDADDFLSKCFVV